MQNKHIAVQELELKIRNGNPELTISSGISTDITTNGYNHFTNISFSEQTGQINCLLESDSGFIVEIAEKLNLNVKEEATLIAKNDYIGLQWYFIGNEKQEYIFTKKI